jgi:membrane protein
MKARLFAGAMRVLREAWIEYERDRARYLAAAMVYYALLSLVPLLVLLLATLGLLLRFSAIAADAQQRVLLAINERFGAELAETIHRLMDTLQQESIIATALSLAGVLLTASVLFRHLRLSFRAIWKHEAPLVSGSVRVVVLATLLERLIAFLMVLAGGGLLVGALVLIGAAQWLGRFLGSPVLPGQITAWLLAALEALIVVAIAFAALLKVLPPVCIRWRDVWPAALLCAVAWVAASELLVLYAVFIGDRTSAYGALGGVLALMLWMNVVSKALFFGAELCKVTAMRTAREAAACGRP